MPGLQTDSGNLVRREVKFVSMPLVGFVDWLPALRLNGDS
jgi:hypothetical protein